MTHKHRHDQLTLLPVIPQHHTEDGIETLFNRPSAIIGYQCSIEEKAELTENRIPCESIEPRWFLPLHEAEQKYKEMSDG